MRVKFTDILVAVLILAIILLIIIPLSPGLMDFFLIANITMYYDRPG